MTEFFRSAQVRAALAELAEIQDDLAHTMTMHLTMQARLSANSRLFPLILHMSHRFFKSVF